MLELEEKIEKEQIKMKINNKEIDEKKKICYRRNRHKS